VRDWWPDLRGKAVVIAGSGASQSASQLKALRPIGYTIVINETRLLAPWANMLYACDRRYWEVKKPEFDGLKVSGQKVDQAHCANVRAVDEMLWGDEVGGGGNSGFQSLNLALKWGSRKIILTGIDLTGGHWHQAHGAGLANPQEQTFKRWLSAFRKASPICEDMGADVVVCSHLSALDCFRRQTVEGVLSEGWGL